MVKLIILYYLNIKSTHGYEIQKFLNLSGMDAWTQIKSGSIYYALSRMEKNGEVKILREEVIGSKVRKIYTITTKGKIELNNSIESELAKPLFTGGNDKFIIPMTFNKIEKIKAIKIINNHITELRETLGRWKYWYSLKIGETSLNVDKISFEMTIRNIEDAINWHKALIEDYDQYIEYSINQEKMIRHVKFDEINERKVNSEQQDEARITQLRNIIVKEPEKVKEALEELMRLIGRNKIES